jgi:hypothetical protein
MIGNLLDLAPNKVSRDYSGYPIVFLGETGDGKTDSINRFLTSIAKDGKVPLFIALEDATMIVPNIKAVRVHDESELLQVYGQLKNPALKNIYSCVVFDTADKFEQMNKSYIQSNKEVEIIEDIGFSKGRKYLKSKSGIVNDIRNLGYPVHFTAQLYKTVDFSSNKTVYKTKLDEATTQQMFHDAFLVGCVKLDTKAKNPLTSDRLITFKKSETYPDLKDKFGLPDVMHVSDLKNQLDIVFGNRYKDDELQNESIIDEIKETETFEDIVKRGMECGKLLFANGKEKEALYILKTELGEDKDGSRVLTLTDLNSSQIDVAKVVTFKLDELVTKYNLKK